MKSLKSYRGVYYDNDGIYHSDGSRTTVDECIIIDKVMTKFAGKALKVCKFDTSRYSIDSKGRIVVKPKGRKSKYGRK